MVIPVCGILNCDSMLMIFIVACHYYTITETLTQPVIRFLIILRLELKFGNYNYCLEMVIKEMPYTYSLKCSSSVTLEFGWPPRSYIIKYIQNLLFVMDPHSGDFSGVGSPLM